MQVTTLLKGALIALLATTAASANAANSVNATYTFDNVATGSTANAALGDDYSFMYFANADKQFDDPNGVEGDPFHWIDATASYGDVLAKSDANAISGSNVLWNDNAPMLLLFRGNSNVTNFSVKLAGFNTTSFFGGAVVTFLDSTLHSIAGSEAFADSNGLVSISAPQYNVAGILISSGGNYDNLSIAAVPESDTYAMLLAGLGIMAMVARRRG
jgi:hypothetical protein